jgi:hypothetical protein
MIGITNSLGAVELDLEFDSTYLTYNRIELSPFSEAWDFFDANLLPGDRVRIGGFTIPDETPGSPETLVNVVFDVDPDGSGDQQLTTMNLGADFAGIPACTRFLTITACAGDGDVNRDGALTTGDALCAFRCFLNAGEMTADCLFGSGCEATDADANCDGTCTPGDALWIFDRFLCDQGPLPCGGQSEACTAPRETPVVARLRFGDVEIPAGETVRIPIEVQGSGRLRTFGFDLSPVHGIEVTGVEPSIETASWPAFDSGRSGSGEVRVGGLDPLGVTLNERSWTSLGSLVVHSSRGATADQLQVSATHGEIAGGVFESGEIRGEIPSTFRLDSARPNPFSTTVSIDFSIPAGSHDRVEIRVFNVHGQAVRTLVDGVRLAGRHDVRWDGRDDTGARVAAGTYFYRMSAGPYEATRKIVYTR